MPEKLEKKGFTIVATKHEVTCSRGHKISVNSDDIDNVECDYCENDKKAAPIVEKINREEDITLEEFLELLLLKEIELTGELCHKCYKCSQYLIHVHYNGKCFNRSSESKYYIPSEYDDWEERDVSESYGDGYIGEYDGVTIEPYQLDELI